MSLQGFRETEEEFEKTKEFLKKIHFYEMHIFKYSRRQGTRADKMDNQIPEEIKTKRSAELIRLADRMSKEFRDYYIGKEEEVLFEEEAFIDGKNRYTGYTREYVKVAAESAQKLDNTLKKGRITGTVTDNIYKMEL